VTVSLDAEIIRLLFDQVTSFEALEALLLLHRMPACALSASEVAGVVRLDAAATTAALTDLAALGLLTLEKNAKPHTYRYAPDNAQTAATVDRLARLYAERPVEVIKQMSANAIERLRYSAARAFSDAFIFRGRKR
jgi:hypothetical protein